MIYLQKSDSKQANTRWTEVSPFVISNLNINFKYEKD